MDSLNLSVSDIRPRLHAFEEDVDEGGRGDAGRRILPTRRREGPRLLYYFMKLFELLGGNVCLTTYMERGRSEYFAGFTNAYMVDAPLLNGRPVERYRWLSLSLIFRASRPMTF